MTFARIASSGWGYNEELTAAQITALDLDHSRAVDGYAGGAYTPSAQLTFTGPSTGGSLQVAATTATMASPNGLNYAQTANAAGLLGGAWATVNTSTLTVVSGSTFAVAAGATVTSAPNWSISAGTWAYAGASVIALSSTASITFATGTSASWNTGSTSNWQSGSTSTFFTGSILKLQGQVQNAVATALDSDSHTYDGRTHRVFVPTLTAPRTYQLLNANSDSGCEIEFSTIGSAGTKQAVTITDNAGATLLSTMQTKADTATDIVWAKFVHNGTAWKLFNYSVFS